VVVRDYVGVVVDGDGDVEVDVRTERTIRMDGRRQC
jgi:hypothetical protein